MKKFEWTAELMRRALHEFPCIECGFGGDPNLPTYFHADGCSRGVDLPESVKKERLAIWAKNLQKILEKESHHKKPAISCPLCHKETATGTVWLAYHDVSHGLVLLKQYPTCDDCSLIPPDDWVEGRKWGFAYGVVTEKNWELMDFLERTNHYQLGQSKSSIK